MGIVFRGVQAAAGLAVFLLIAAWLYTHPGRGPVAPVDPNHGAYVENIQGQTVVHLRGTPYEMGFQHGALLRDGVVKGIHAFHTLLEAAKEESGVPVFVSNFLLDCVYRRCAPHIPARFLREMEGLADGAGVDLRILRRVHVISELTERNCSSFAVFGKATARGNLYHGHNFDWVMDAGLQDNTALFLYEPDGREAFAAFGYAGMIGYVTGLNRQGISVGMIGAVNKDGRSDGLPLMLLIRRVLEEARNVYDAERIISGARRTVGYNYVVADGEARLARAFETSARHCAIFTDADPRETAEYAIPIDDAVFRADEAMDPTVRRFQTCSNGYPKMPYGSNSYDHRYLGMANGIKANYGKIDETIALEILKSVAMRDTNLHSVLCDSTRRRMWVAHAAGLVDAWKQTYIHFDLNQLFLSPEKRNSRSVSKAGRSAVRASGCG